MANLADPKAPGFPAVYQLELTDRVKAGAGGIANRQAEQLVERTAFLKKQIDDIVSGALVAEYADRLKTPRTIAITGDGSWAVTFDGNGNVSGVLTLSNSGVAAGSYGIVTVDAKGRVTAGRQMAAGDVPALDWSKIASGKPTTLNGYGITDAQLSSPDLTALANLKGAPGIYVNTGPGSAVVRTLAAGQGVTVSNGDGKAGNPSIALSNSGVAAGSYGIVTVDAMGRVTAGRQMTTGDVPALDWSKITTGKPSTLEGYGIKEQFGPLISSLSGSTGAVVDANAAAAGLAFFGGGAANVPVDGPGVILTTALQNGLALQLMFAASGSSAFRFFNAAKSAWGAWTNLPSLNAANAFAQPQSVGEAKLGEHAVRLDQFSGQFSSGSFTMPNGSIIKVGSAIGSSNGPANITFPTAFPNSCQYVVPVTVMSQAYAPCITKPSRSGFTLDVWGIYSTASLGVRGSATVLYLAVGE
ncbi:hypothetical protein K5M33_09980 [Chromobacterium vaccinii]|nr:hypothetical protein [Chromobacterium vaccinii]MBX9357048.1 hypothetical protein [Chromobacterium vaccinii]